MKNIPILILHGWNLSAAKFYPLENELTQHGYKVYCPDLPGFGQSKIPSKPLYLSDYADYVNKFIRKNKLSEVIIIGHSFGGRISIKLASENPKYLRALILAGAPGIVPVPRSKIIFFLYIAKIGNLIFSIPLLNLFKNKARKILYRTAKATDFYNTDKNMRETFKNIVKEKLELYLPQVDSPTLLLWGEKDGIVPVGIAIRMNKLIKKSVLVRIDDAKHGLPWTHPKIFTTEVEKFLKSI